MIPVRDTIPSRHPPVAVMAIIGCNVGVFLIELALPEASLRRLFYLFGMVPARYSHPEWARALGFPADDLWPFLTSMFLHGGWMHIVSNMWFLWLFGDNVEDRMGPLRFTIFYLLCGIAAGLLHWFTNPDSTVPAVGASGAIAGVMGAYFLLFPYSTVICFFPLFFIPWFFELPAFIYLGIWFLTQLHSGTLSLVGPGAVGGVAWWAHIGGFVAGMALMPLFLRPRKARRPLALDEFGLEGAWGRGIKWRS